MTRAGTTQGVGFSILAIAVSLFTVTMREPSQRMELIVLGILILLLGIPHGALDTVFATQLYGVRTIKSWCVFGLAYMIPVAMVVAMWQFAPVMFLLLFLAISIAHFSGDPADGTSAVVRTIYGGLIILIPVLRHTAEVTRLFALLVGERAATDIVPWLVLLGWPWLTGAVVAVGFCLWNRCWLTALEITSVGMLAALADPLVAFAVFFCGMHSARHILRTVEYSGGRSLRFVIGACLAPMAGFVILLAAASFWLRNVPIEARLLQLIFVGLAALTVPHMVLVERVRIAGWRMPEGRLA